MTIKNGYTTDADDVRSIVLKAGIMSLANIQKSVYLNTTSTTALSIGTMNNFAGEEYLVDGFVSAGMVSSPTLVVDNVPSYGTDNVALPYQNRAYIAKINTELNGSYGVGASKITTTNLYALAKDSEFVIKCTSVANESISVQISNGATHVTVYAVGGGSPSANYTLKVKLDYSAKNAYVSTGGAFGAGIDISSVTTNWYVRVISSEAGGYVYFMGYVDGSTDTVNYISATKTMSSTKSSGILTWDANTNSIVGYLSADSGSNYSLATKDDWTTIANTGTGAKMKLICSLPGLVEATDANSYIKEIKAVGAYLG